MKLEMTFEDINRFKKISIRGRVAYGLLCLENLKSTLNKDLVKLEQLIKVLWQMTNSDKLGWWQNEFIEYNPRIILSDYELMKKGEITFEQIGLETVKTKIQFIERVKFLSQLKKPIPTVLNKLCSIANQNISAGCGEFSELTLVPTIELIEIIEKYDVLKLPEIEVVEFSKFEENNGWGNKFDEKLFKR